MEYIKLFWAHHLPEEPTIILYEVDIENERFAKRSIDIFRDGSTQNIPDLYADVIEVVPILTVEEFNSIEYGEEFQACLITKEEFEEVWNGLYKADQPFHERRQYCNGKIYYGIGCRDDQQQMYFI